MPISIILDFASEEEFRAHYRVDAGLKFLFEHLPRKYITPAGAAHGAVAYIVDLEQKVKKLEKQNAPDE